VWIEAAVSRLLLWPKKVPTPASPEAETPVPAAAPVELAVVIPTLNERDNVPLIVERLNRALAGVAWEVVFVDDDSPDGTADAVRDLARRQGNIRCLQRVGRRGLSSACIEGMLASTAPYLAVMDGDLQHDETLLPRMLDKIKSDHLDIVIASRHVSDGSIGNFAASRVRISDFATRLSRIVVKAELSDPMSGFFMIERGAFTGAVRRLSGQGFKILLDLFASAPRPFVFAELPLKFRERLHGESKLDTLVAWEYFMLLLQKLIGPAVPVRFLLFSLIGGLGVGVHLATLWVMLHLAPFSVAQTVATVVAMTGNFLLNNLFTYRDRRLTGWRILSGLGSFYAVCGLGAVANVGIAASIAGRHSWWLAGLAGAAVSAVWNYAASSVFTWSARRPAVVPARTR
jgi:dolichol-phosphate mannosyltransferase